MFKTFPQAMTLGSCRVKKEDSVGAAPKYVCESVPDGTTCRAIKHKMMFILC